MTKRIWVLGASDPEMEAIEHLLRRAAERVVYATIAGRRVRPAEAYVDGLDAIESVDDVVVLVECVPPVAAPEVVIVDHHRPGDPGYGRPPEDFWAASSVGQVWALLGLPAPSRHSRAETKLVAAADHCLGAAYRGQCPGVDPDHLAAWRAASRARYQGRSVDDVLADVAAATQALAAAPLVDLHAPGRVSHTTAHNWSRTVCDGCALDPAPVRDMRRDTPIPELPEAATRAGEAYVSGPLIGPDGRRKYTVSGPPEVVAAWMRYPLPAGLEDIYGDPQRGFAGGYEYE